MLPDGVYTSAWYSAEGLVASGLLQRGYLLEFQRMTYGRHLYSHWAVFVDVPRGGTDGIPRVIHLWTPDGDFGVNVPQEDQGFLSKTIASIGASAKISSSGTVEATVRCDPLKDVAGEDQVRINNLLDKSHRRFCDEIIIQRAEEKVGKEGYSLFFDNCEHFCHYCRYDENTSTQVSALKNVVAPIVGGIATVAGFAATVAMVIRN